MKATIHQIVERISALSEPMDPVLVQKIFIDYPEFTSSDHPRNIEYTWTQLDFILKLAQQGVELKAIIKDLKAHEADIILYTEKGIVAQGELNALELELIQLQTAITKSRAGLTELYSNLLHTLRLQAVEEPQPETPAEAITKRQLKHILDIRSDLQREIKLLTLPTAKLKLRALKEKQTELLNTIENYIERYNLERKLPAINNEESWTVLQFTLSQKIQKTLELLPKLEKLQEGFADCLSTADTQKKIATLQRANSKIVKELDTIAQKMQTHDLAPKIQAALIEEFQQTTNVQALLDSYKSHVDTALSYVNLSLWTTWISDKEKYNASQIEHVHRVDFLNLLKQQKEKQAQQTHLLDQINILTKISNATLMSTATEERLVNQATSLLNELPECRVPENFSPKADVTDFYLLLINNIFLIPEHIKQFEVYLSLVNQLIPVMNELLRYRREYNLPPDQDELIPRIEELQKALPEEASLSHKKEQLQTCEQYISKTKLLVANLKLQTEKTQFIHEMRKEITFNIGQLQIALDFKAKLQQQKTFATQIEEQNNKLLICQTDMVNIKKKIKTGEEACTKVLIDTTPKETDKPPTVHEKQSIVVEEQLPLTAIEVKQQQEIVHQLSPTVLHSPPIALEQIKIKFVEPELEITATSEVSEPKQEIKIVSELTEPKLTVTPIMKTEPVSMEDSQADNKPIVVHVDAIQPNLKSEEKSAIKKDEPIIQPTATLTKDVQNNKVLATTEILPPIIPSLDTTHTTPPTKIKQPDTLPSSKKEESIQLANWHRANIDALQKYSPELQSWYQELYARAESALMQTPYSQKYSHLIRDIFFELQIKKELYVIESYQSLCPTPQDDCTALLALKPEYVISEHFADELEKEQLPLPLMKLNNQYKQLKRKHPVAAELLLQTLQNLYCTWKKAKSSPTSSPRPSLMDDPRYDVLKRQRGFLKIVQAIEDFYHWLEGKCLGQAEYEYRQKPSFFKTHSEVLVNEAELFVAQPMPH